MIWNAPSALKSKGSIGLEEQRCEVLVHILGRARKSAFPEQRLPSGREEERSGQSCKSCEPCSEERDRDSVADAHPGLFAAGGINSVDTAPWIILKLTELSLQNKK